MHDDPMPNDETPRGPAGPVNRLRFDVPARSGRPPRDPPPDVARLQFGLRSMFVLTTVFAVILAIAFTLDFPPLFRGVVVGYLVLLAFYGVLRLPTVVRRIRWAMARRREIQEEREELARKLARAVSSRTGRAARGPSDDEPVG